MKSTSLVKRYKIEYRSRKIFNKHLTQRHSQNKCHKQKSLIN
jgi:hypothetical protein